MLKGCPALTASSLALTATLKSSTSAQSRTRYKHHHLTGLNTVWYLQGCYSGESWLTFTLYSVNDTSDCLAIHNDFTLILARGEASEEAHLVVVIGRHLLSTRDTPQDDVRVGVRHTAGDGDSSHVHWDNQVFRGLGNKWSLGIWVCKQMNNNTLCYMSWFNCDHNTVHSHCTCTWFYLVKWVTFFLNACAHEKAYSPGTNTYIPASFSSSRWPPCSPSWVSYVHM